MEFENVTRKVIEEECEDYFLGIVDLSLADNDVIEQYDVLIAEYPRAVSIGITIPNMVTDKLFNRKIGLCETNKQLNNITVQLSNLLEQEGYKTLTLPKTRTVNDKTFISLHVLAAKLANLGWIEKNSLVTPEVGPNVDWGTILTDAPLDS